MQNALKRDSDWWKCYGKKWGEFSEYNAKNFDWK